MCAEKHSEELSVKKFCTQRKSKCSPCGNSYTDVVKKGPLAAAFKFPRLVKKQAGPVTQDISQNAHHILCVAEVTKVISKDDGLRRVLESTVYCINKKRNMIALPLFAHTVYWYCLCEDSGVKQLLGDFSSSLLPPLFLNLPNHCFDHGKYNKEIESSLKKLKADVKQAGHDFSSNEVAACLYGMSDAFRAELLRRGVRQGGTHQAWQGAARGEKPEWYEPFSLANDGDVVPKTFPRQTKKTKLSLLDAIQNSANAILNR